MIKEFRAKGKTSGIDHAKTRPAITEVLAVERLIRFSKDNGVPLYLVHISSPEAVIKHFLGVNKKISDTIIEKHKATFFKIKQ